MHHTHMNAVLDALAWVLPMLVAITFHEAAHGFMARLFGDYTAASQGRVTLNPIRHIDPFGTVVLPAMLLLAHSPVLFGYAKPVPVTFGRLSPKRLGELCVAAAGPGMNLLLAGLSALLLHVQAVLTPEQAPWLFLNLYRGVIINCVLAVFNLVPVLPLDGGRVVHALLPKEPAAEWAKTERFGLIIVLILLFMPGLVHFNLMNRVGQGAQTVASWVLEATGNGTPAGWNDGQM